MKIHAPEILREGEEIRIQSLVEFAGRKEYLWYSVDIRYGEYLTTERMDGFLVALLLLAMKHGEDITVDGAISEKLYYNLTNYYMRLVKSVIPSLYQIAIVPKALDSGTFHKNNGGVATGFSGGIDSFSLLADHLYGDVPEAYKITHFIYNNVGSHGFKGETIFHGRYKKLRNFSDEVGVQSIKINSNLHKIIDMDFEKTHTPRNVSAILIFQNLFGKYLYASTFKYEDCFVGPSDDMAYSDPFAVHLLSSETLECLSTGCQYSRVEKTMKVVEMEPSYRYLDVCSASHSGNCSICGKCARTLLTIEILGKLDLYERVFDLKAYDQIRNRYIVGMLRSKDPLLKEIVQLAMEKEICFNSFHKVVSLLPKDAITKIWGLVPKSSRHFFKNLMPKRQQK